MQPKKRMVFLTFGITLAGTMIACAPRENAGEEGPAGDTLAAGEPAPSGAPGPAEADSVPAELVGTAWRLVEFDAGNPVPEGVEITAEFRSNGMAGRGGCNQYTGPVRIDLAAGTFDAGALVATRMACPPPQMESETRYLDLLERATGVALEPGRLTIGSEDAGATSTLVFAPADSL